MSWGVPSAIPHFPTSNQVFTKNSKKNTRFYKMHHKEAKLTCSHFQWIWISWQRIWHFWRIIYILHDILQHQHRVVWVFFKGWQIYPYLWTKIAFWALFCYPNDPKKILYQISMKMPPILFWGLEMAKKGDSIAFLSSAGPKFGSEISVFWPF